MKRLFYKIERFFEWAFNTVCGVFLLILMGVGWVLGGTSYSYDDNHKKIPGSGMPTRQLIKMMWEQRVEH